MKLLIETVGNYEYLYFAGFLNADRPTVVNKAAAWQKLLGENKIRVIANLNEDANDDEFFEAFKEGDEKVKEYVEQHSVYSVKPRRGRKPKED